MVNFSGAARSRPVPCATTNSRLRCGLARAGVKSTLARPTAADGGDGHGLVVRGSADGQLVADDETVRVADADVVAPALAFAASAVRLDCVPTFVTVTVSIPWPTLSMSKPDLVADRDVGDGRHLDVGRAGRASAQEGLRARLADRSDVATSYFSDAFATAGSGAVADGDLLADDEAGHARDRHVGRADGDRDDRTVGEGCHSVVVLPAGVRR
jgi:hypothetical protein